MSISERLRAELRRPDPTWSTRGFQIKVEEVAGKGTRGTSYASVYEYVEGKGEAEPPLSFLRPAAEVLGVRLEWLIAGSGARTQERQDLGRERELGIKRAVLDGLGCPPPAEEDHTPCWVSVILEAYVRGVVPYRVDVLNPSTIEDEKEKYGVPKMTWISGTHHEGQFKILGEVLRAPLKALGFDVEDMEEEARDTYILDMARALLGLATERSRQWRRQDSYWKNALDTSEEETDDAQE